MPRAKAKSGTQSRKRQEFDLDDGPPITPDVVRDAEQIIQQLQSLTLVEQERQRAEQERQRAEQAEAELQRLKQLLREKGIEL